MMGSATAASVRASPWFWPAPAVRTALFNADERRHLLAAPGLGPLVVARLEQAGVGSIRALRLLGVDTVVARLCEQVGSRAWSNRRHALQRAVDAYTGDRAARPAR
jgi:hypothetical protein